MEMVCCGVLGVGGGTRRAAPCQSSGRMAQGAGEGQAALLLTPGREGVGVSAHLPSSPQGAKAPVAGCAREETSGDSPRGRFSALLAIHQVPLSSRGSICWARASSPWTSCKFLLRTGGGRGRLRGSTSQGQSRGVPQAAAQHSHSGARARALLRLWPILGRSSSKAPRQSVSHRDLGRGSTRGWGGPPQRGC